MSSANVNANMARITTHPFFEDQAWEQIQVGMAQYLSPELRNVSRMCRLGTEALKEVLEKVKETKMSIDLFPLFIGVPSERPRERGQFGAAFQKKSKYRK